MKKTIIDVIRILSCGECGNEVPHCDSCKKYFMPDDICWHDGKGNHYCDNCKQEGVPV